MAGSMTACMALEEQLRAYIMICWTRETLTMAQASETSKPALSDTLAPTMPHLLISLILSNSVTPWWLGTQIYETVRAIFIQTTTVYNTNVHPQSIYYLNSLTSVKKIEFSATTISRKTIYKFNGFNGESQKHLRNNKLASGCTIINVSTQETIIGGLWVQDQLGLHTKTLHQCRLWDTSLWVVHSGGPVGPLSNTGNC